MPFHCFALLPSNWTNNANGALELLRPICLDYWLAVVVADEHKASTLLVTTSATTKCARISPARSVVVVSLCASAEGQSVWQPDRQSLSWLANELVPLQLILFLSLTGPASLFGFVWSARLPPVELTLDGGQLCVSLSWCVCVYVISLSHFL